MPGTPNGAPSRCSVAEVLELVRNSLAGQPAAGSKSPYSAPKQLLQAKGKRIAVLVIDDKTWEPFAIPLRERWIHWSRPAFLPSDSNWDAFRASKPASDKELFTRLRALHEIWIMKWRRHRLTLEFCWPVSGKYRHVVQPWRTS